MSLPTCWILQGNTFLECVSPFNRGLAYGDGLFETMRVCAGKVPLLQQHLDRLSAGLIRLDIPFSPDTLIPFFNECCRGVDQAVLKLIVVRGEGGRGYLPADDALPVVIISRHALPVYAENYAASGLSIGISTIRLARNSLLAGLKHLNRLEQVLVRKQLHQAGFIEGVVLDTSDFVVEASFSNICMVSKGVLVTPALHSAGVAGVMRGWVLDHARRVGLPAAEDDIRLADILRAEEVFLCNSVNGIWPVTAIADRQWAAIGSMTRNIQCEVASLFQ